tara:strand:+ start:349 stop:477 length:129 start_codon:yes stop_codon:yes gene_type:complete
MKSLKFSDRNNTYFILKALLSLEDEDFFLGFHIKHQNLSRDD